MIVHDTKLLLPAQASKISQPLKNIIRRNMAMVKNTCWQKDRSVYNRFLSAHGL